MTFLVNKNLAFIESMQFSNSNLKNLVRKLSDINFKHFTEECCPKNLELIKQKHAYPYEYRDSFKGKMG